MHFRSTVRIEPSDPITGPARSLVARVQQVFSRNQDEDRCRLAEVEALSLAAAAERRIAALEEEVARLRRIAVTDELTGLLNRRGFQIEIERALGLARRHGEGGGLVIIDLDGFKLINDGFGHAAGDAVLRQTAAVLAASVRATDVVARLGGDEFGVLLLRSSAGGAAKRAAVLDRLLNASVAMHDGHVIAIQASVGCEAYGPDSDGDTLMSRADADMYRRKQRQAAGVALTRSRAGGVVVRDPAAADRER